MRRRTFFPLLVFRGRRWPGWLWMAAKPVPEAEMAEIRKRASGLAGPRLENWERDVSERASGRRYWDGAPA